MKTYLFKVVKSDYRLRYDTDYDMGGYLSASDGYHAYARTFAPSSMRCNKINHYLLDLKTANIELIRFVANTLCQAELSILKNQCILFVEVYEMELGKKITSKTKMKVLFPYSIDYQRGNYDVTTFDNRGRYKSYYTFTKFNAPTMIPRHTLYGSGRYKAVCQFDAPRYYWLGGVEWRKDTALEPDINDDFIGLNVAFATMEGKAIHHVYMGGLKKDNYYLDPVGRIVLHKRGSLYHGDFDNYRKAMLAIWPMFSENAIDKNGVLVKGRKVIDKPFPHLVTDFKAQRRNAFSKLGNSEVFKKRLNHMMENFILEWTLFVNDVQSWGHNLNYDVNGFQRTFNVYLKAEKMLRLISQYFPNELKFDTAKASLYSSFQPIANTECLKLGNRRADVGEVWDALCILVDWLRRNYVSYQMKGALPPRVYSSPGTPDRIVAKDSIVDYDFSRFQEFAPTVEKATQVLVAAGAVNVRGVSVQQDPRINPYNGYYAYQIHFTADQTIKGDKPYHFSVEWGDYNNWLETTSQVAADIEVVYLSFQANSLAFLEMMCHFITICDSIPYEDKKRAKGVLPGELQLTKQQELNKKRTYPRADVPRVVTGTPGQIRDIEKPTNRELHLKPYEIDARAIQKRCAKDLKRKSDEEAEEEYEDSVRIVNAQDRKAFTDQQRINDQKRMMAADKPRFVYRGEIDPPDAQDEAREMRKLYSDIEENLSHVADLANLVNDAGSAFVVVTAPEATPLVIEERSELQAAETLGKEVIRHVAQDHIREFLESEPEFNPQGTPTQVNPASYTFEPLPRPAHEYAPPKRYDNPEFTGEEPFPREYVEVKPAPEEYTESGGYFQNEGGVWTEDGRYFEPGTDVDLEITYEMEAPNGRELVQEDVRTFDDVPDVTAIGRRWTEKRPLDRYRCVRAAPRVPRK